MARRRPAHQFLASSPAAPLAWTILRLDETSSSVLAVGDSLRLPSGAVLQMADGRLELHPGALAVRLNDVELKGVAPLRPGDQFIESSVTYLVLPDSEQRAAPVTRLGHSAFLARLEEETLGDREFAVVLARSTAFAWLRPEELFGGLRLSVQLQMFAQPTPQLVELLVFHDLGMAIELLKRTLAKAAEGTDDTIQWGVAFFPRDGGTPEELWAAAVDRLLGLETPGSQELRFADPSMVRLWNLADPVSRMRSPLILIGEPGVGRETFARRVRTLNTPGAPFVVHGAGRFDRRRWDEDVTRASGGALHLRHPGVLPHAEQAAFLSARQFVPSASFDPRGDRPSQGSQVFLPSLRDRALDVVPIAEQVLHLTDTRLARRRSTIRLEARQGLSSLVGRENARSLRNGVVRAALALTGSELRVEHLEESRASSGTGVENLRQQLRDTERRALEEALRQTRWNVSEASRLMRLPRRTVVYRMRRLGVRRPTSKL